MDDHQDRAGARTGRRSRWARRGAWVLAVLLVPTGLAVPLANAFDSTAEDVAASAPLAPVGLQAPTNMQSPDAVELNAKAAAEAAEDYEDAALRHPTTGQPEFMYPNSAAAALKEATATATPTATPAPAAAATATPAPAAAPATPTPSPGPADPVPPVPAAASAPPGSQAAIDLAAAKAELDAARAEHMRQVQRVMQYVQAQEATAGGVAGLPDDVEGVLGEDPALIDDDPNNKPPSLVERRAAATRGVDGADKVMKSITPEDIKAAGADLAKLTDELAGLTGDALTRKALDVALAQARLDELKTTLAQARGNKADARTTRHVNDVWYRDRVAAILLEVDRDTAVDHAADAVEQAEASYRQAQLDEAFSVVARDLPVVGGTVDVAWGLWRPVGRVTVDLARALDHVFGPP